MAAGPPVLRLGRLTRVFTQHTNTNVDAARQKHRRQLCESGTTSSIRHASLHVLVLSLQRPLCH
eukprot:536218-Amphidinium_carterae.1